MYKQSFAALAMLSLAGCATRAGTTRVVEQAVVGQSVEHVVALYGVPNREANLDGVTYYTWEKSISMLAPSVATSTGTVGGKSATITTHTTSAGTVVFSCELTIQVRDSVVTDFTLRGSDCTAFRP